METKYLGKICDGSGARIENVKNASATTVVSQNDHFRLAGSAPQSILSLSGM